MNKLEQQLLDSGYRHYDFFDERGVLYQKGVCDCDGNKVYYLNAYYNAPKQLTHILLPEIIHWCVQFHLSSEDYFDVDYYTTNINEAEQLFEKMFDSMECVAAWCVE